MELIACDVEVVHLGFAGDDRIDHLRTIHIAAEEAALKTVYENGIICYYC
jgi:hypothetical protein